MTVMPFIEVYRGNVCIEAGPDKELASQACTFTPTSISCTDAEHGGGYAALRQLMENTKTER